MGFIMFIGNWIVRFKAVAIYLPTIATAVIAHENLLHLPHRQNDLLTFLCFLVLAVNQPVVSKMQERK